MQWLILVFIYLFSNTIAYADIKIGNPPFRPPFVLDQKSGFDIQLMGTICKRLNETCEFYPMAAEKLFGALQEGDIDVAIGGITISEARKVDYIFSLPYLISEGEFLVLKSNGFQSINDLKGKKIGTVMGSNYEDFLANHYGLQFQIVLYTDPVYLVSSLNQGEIAAVFLSRESMGYWKRQSAGLLVSLGKPVLIDGGYAIMATPKNTALIQSINQVLKEIENDGTLVTLYENYLSN
ncbi:transporter substrate-binding domain-containing protein [Legionella fairfieldensis]|uniref:transporter substrate-binding domain-containing protein n=1 Tax=Legionella fairfieldensis TaxID=45064 RepID=UPI00048B7350|nr:transporter substrate-binding domain-containing protein [Legionella fairfieldensis]